MTIASEIEDLQTNLAAAKAAVTTKGGTVGDTGLAGLATEIASIPSGGGYTGTPYGKVFFYSIFGPLWTVDMMENCEVEITNQATWYKFCTTPIDQGGLGFSPVTDSSSSIVVQGRIENNDLIFTDSTGQDSMNTFWIDPEDPASVEWVEEYCGLLFSNFDPSYASFSTVCFFTIDTSSALLELTLSSMDMYNAFGTNDSASVMLTTGLSLPKEAIKKFELGTDVTTTPTNFLYHCTSLTDLDMTYASSLTSIGDAFLSECSSFNKAVPLPSGLTSIGHSFLFRCTAFNQPITIPSGITTIPEKFLSFTQFNQPITIPSGVTSIGNEVMAGLNNFNYPVVLPSGLTSLGYSFLANDSRFNQPITIPSSLTSIPANFLYMCRSFNQPVTVPSNITSIERKFLYGCTMLNSAVSLPEGLTSLGEEFMYGCVAFNQPITLPSTLTSIGDYFLRGCALFNQPIVIPNSVTTIGVDFLRDCSKFNQSITFPSNLVTFPADFLWNCFAYNQPIVFPNTVQTIGAHFLQFCSNYNQDITLPSSLTSSLNYFMYGCNSMTSTVYLGSLPSNLAGNSNYNMSVQANNVPAYTTGITISGTYAADWATKLPNRTSSAPYRKLIVAS